jgi:predicted nucleic acid-binding protein
VTRALFDSSALFKRYNEERGSDRVRALSADVHEIVVAVHCKTEIASAINRNRHDGFVPQEAYVRIMADVHRDFSDFRVLGWEREVEAFAIAAMERNRLRAMDAIHIASAQAARVDLFVTADRRQAQAAMAAGLKTELVEA